MNLSYLILAGLWSGTGARLALRVLSGKTSSNGTSQSPWAEVLGWVGGVLPAFGLETAKVITEAREAPGFSATEIKWTLIVLAVTATVGFVVAFAYQLAAARRLARNA